jgi:hypothetical protein
MEAAALFQQSCTLMDDAPIADPLSNSSSTSNIDPPIDIPREQEIKETFTQGMKMLKDLKRGVPATSAKLERAKDVVSHVYS